MRGPSRWPNNYGKQTIESTPALFPRISNKHTGDRCCARRGSRRSPRESWSPEPSRPARCTAPPPTRSSPGCARTARRPSTVLLPFIFVPVASYRITQDKKTRKNVPRQADAVRGPDETYSRSEIPVACFVESVVTQRARAACLAAFESSRTLRASVDG